MRSYLDLLRRVRDDGVRRGDRTGTGTVSVFGHQMRFDLAEGFPLVTTKRVWFKGLAVELLWFLSGSTSILPLIREGVSIWTDWPLEAWLQARLESGAGLPEPWRALGAESPRDVLAWKRADPERWRAARKPFESALLDGTIDAGHAELGPVYGKQWRRWAGPDGREIDQVAAVLHSLRTRPESRRHIVTAWNVADLDAMALPPCHMTFQFYVADGRLSCGLYVRSNDLFLGAPFNIGQYALLVHLMAAQLELAPGELVYTIGDAHLYLNHLEQVDEQLARTPRALPRLELLRRPGSLFDYTYDDLALHDYAPHPSIAAPVAV